jgi:glutathione-regulated potassium-efflux system ancillary protein KefF
MLRRMTTTPDTTTPPADEGMPPRQPIYLIAAHPDWRSSRVTRRLLTAAEQQDGVRANDLYSSYPDYAIDVGAEQGRLAQAELVVLMFPLHWYSMPALLKLWLDEVLAYGWAYGPTRAALHGKHLWLVTSTGGPEKAYQPGGYNRHHIDAYLLPWRQTAHLCGMKYLPPLVLMGAGHVTDSTLDQHAARLAERLQSWPRWAHLALDGDALAAPVPVTDRPEPHIL